jgi:hypothetical protein
MIILDPERLTGAQWFWICFILLMAIFWLCCYVDLHYQFHPL